MNRIFISGNYIIVERDGIISEYSMGNTVYTIKDDSFIIRESEFGQMIIPYTEIDSNEWSDENYNPLTQSDVLTFLRSNTGFKLPLNGGGESAINYASVIWVDNVNGNDATALIGRFDKPHLTIQSALTMANAQNPTSTNRATVWVRSGNYANAGNITPYNFCDVVCDNVLFTGYFYLTDQFTGSAVNFNWYGNAKWDLSMSQFAFRIQYASTISINGDSFVNTGAICLAYNVTVGISNITFNFNSIESTQTIGTGYAFTLRNNCNVALNVKNYMKSPHSMFDIRANHSGKIMINCAKLIMTSPNIYGGNFKQIVYASNSSATSETTINSDLINESPAYLGGLSTMILMQGAGKIKVNGNIYSGQTIGTWNAGNCRIVVDGSIYSDVECFINNSTGDSFFRNGIMVLSSLSTVRLGFVSGNGKVWMQNICLNSSMVDSDIIKQESNTSKIFMLNVQSEGIGSTSLINGTVAGIVNQFTNVVSSHTINANVTNELAQGLTIDTLIKTPKF